MNDNPFEPGPRDDDRINVLVESDVAYWSKKLGVSRARLAQAIEAVGDRVGDVKKWLESHP
jgi:hypothetical protein